MLGICFFIPGGEYTGEPVWEGKKGAAGERGDFWAKAETLKTKKLNLEGRRRLFPIIWSRIADLRAQLPRPAAAFGLQKNCQAYNNPLSRLRSLNRCLGAWEYLY